MTRGILYLVLFCVFSLSFSAFADKEIIQLRNGTFLRGEVVEVTSEEITVRIEGGQMKLPVSVVMPASLYHIRAARIAPGDAKAHLELGEFAFKNELFTFARAEYTRAMELDPSLVEMVRMRIQEIDETEARMLYEKAMAYITEKKLTAAEGVFQELVQKYPATEYARKAADALGELRKEIKAAEEARRREETLEKAREQQLKSEKLEALLRRDYETATVLYKEGVEFNVKGLDEEGLGRVSAAERAFVSAVEKFLASQQMLDKLIAKTKDVDMLSMAKRKLLEVTDYLVLVYINLGHLRAVEGDFKQATKWLNKALAIDPKNPTATELKLMVAEQRIRRRASDWIGPKTGTE